MKTQQFISRTTEIFSQIDTSAQFIAIHKYQNNFGEVSDYSLCWNINYSNAVEKSKNILRAYKPSIEDCIGKPYTVAHLELALAELLMSFQDTITLGPGNNPLSTSAHAYDKVVDKFGKPIPGVMVHREQDVLHLTSVYRIHKVIHIPGVYPKVNSQLKTLAKNDLRAKLPLKKFGQFKLELGRFEKIVVRKLTITEQDVIRKDV